MSGLLMAIAGALHPMSSGPKPPVQIILTAGTSWTVPSDWNNANNKVECVSSGSASLNGFFGGGGGAYALKNNVALSPGASVPISVGLGIATAFGSPAIVKAAYGVNATSTRGGKGGLASACVGDVAFSGGDGSAAGGGAAGPHGNGASGGAQDDSYNSKGGDADAGYGGAGGLSYHDGAAGTEWVSVGCGGGGGFNNSGSGGGMGGLYGGGGSATRASAPGVIVITYTPV